MASILDTWTFQQFIFIYHSKSNNCLQGYIVSLGMNYYWIYWNMLYLPHWFYFVSFEDLEQCADWYDLQLEDWLTQKYKLTNRSSRSSQLVNCSACNSHTCHSPLENRRPTFQNHSNFGRVSTRIYKLLSGSCWSHNRKFKLSAQVQYTYFC